MRSAPGNAGRRRSAASLSVNVVISAPMPTASAQTTVTAAPRARARERKTGRILNSTRKVAPDRMPAGKPQSCYATAAGRP
jgi:hypothetical protein